MKFESGKIIEKKKFDGEEIIFRFPRKDDARGCTEYINTLVAEEARILKTKKVSLKEEKTWLKERFGKIKKGSLLTLFLEGDEKLIGIVDIFRRTTPPSATDHIAEFGVGLLKEYRGMGVATYAANLLFSLGKRIWKLKLIRSSYISDNVASATLHKRLGFRYIGRIPKGAKYGQKYVDEIIVLKKL